MDLKSSSLHAVLFDLDGTLIDSIDHIVDCWQYTVRTVLDREMARKEILPTIGRHLLTCFEEIAPGRSEELYNVYREYEAAAHDGRIKLVPGTLEVLSLLKKMGVRLGLVTSKGSEIANRGLALFDLAGYFDTLVTREDTERHKPHPDPLLVGAQRLGVAPERTVYVGDSSVDMLAGKAAGMLIAWVVWGADKPGSVDGVVPDYVLKSIDELPLLVRSPRGRSAARLRVLEYKRRADARAQARAIEAAGVSEPIYPFRWDVSKRSQLGTLLNVSEEERTEWLDNALYRRDKSTPIDQWLVEQLTVCCARVLSSCDDSNLYFVCRSPENLFDFLSGILLETSWADRLTLLHFSTGWSDLKDILDVYSTQLEELYTYLEHVGLSPRAIAERPRTTAFVDLVSSGTTFGILVDLLRHWAKRTYPDWHAVQRKLRFVGLTERTKTSPNTWRWQQRAHWVKMLESGSVKNVSIPSNLFAFIGGAAAKTSRSYIPLHWGNPEVRVPLHGDTNARMALALAVRLFDKGRDRATRRAFVAQMAEQPAMKYPWYRALANEIAGR